MKKNIFIILVLGGISVSGLWGQGGIYLGPQLGFTSPNLNLGELEIEGDTTLLYGAKAGLKFFNLGAELNYFRTFHNLVLADAAVFNWEETRLGYHYLGLNAKFFFPLVIIQPYLSGGLGYYFADLKDIADDKSRGFNLGAGIEIQLGSKWSICGEGRYNRVNLVLDEVDVKIRDFTIAGSLHFYFSP